MRRIFAALPVLGAREKRKREQNSPWRHLLLEEARGLGLGVGGGGEKSLPLRGLLPRHLWDAEQRVEPGLEDGRGNFEVRFIDENAFLQAFSLGHVIDEGVKKPRDFFNQMREANGSN